MITNIYFSSLISKNNPYREKHEQYITKIGGGTPKPSDEIYYSTEDAEGIRDIKSALEGQKNSGQKKGKKYLIFGVPSDRITSLLDKLNGFKGQSAVAEVKSGGTSITPLKDTAITVRHQDDHSLMVVSTEYKGGNAN